VLVGGKGTRLRPLSLNRPKALGDLTTGMVALMTNALLAWRDDPAVELVLLDHAGERGFCAGGDIRMLAESGAGDSKAAREFFFTEYRLNTLLFAYRKPVVVIMDGITMGGGVGLAMPCRYRVATEKTLFAMPETAIGLFPDVGGGWWLPRLPGESGLWLALTGARIKAADCLLLGIATDFVNSADVEAIKREILAAPGMIEEILTRYRGDGCWFDIAWTPPDGCFCQWCREERQRHASHRHEFAGEREPGCSRVARESLARGSILVTYDIEARPILLFDSEWVMELNDCSSAAIWSWVRTLMR